MSPVLQAPRRLALRILLRFLFLREMPLAVSHHPPHMSYVFLVVATWTLFRVLL